MAYKGFLKGDILRRRRIHSLAAEEMTGQKILISCSFFPRFLTVKIFGFLQTYHQRGRAG
jgi:hypothetical protein